MDHYISSQYRESGGSDTDFTVKMSIPQSHTHICLKALGLPKSYYNVVSGQNTFQFNNNLFSVVPGFYSVSDLKKQMATLLVGLCTVNWSKITGKFQFTASMQGATLAFPASTLLWRSLGFAKGSSNSFSGTTLVAPFISNLSVIEEAYVTCSVVRDSSLSAFDNTLAVVAVNAAQDLSLIAYEATNPTLGAKELQLGPVESRSQGGTLVAFKLLNELGNTLDLQGHPLTLTVHTFRKEPDLYSLIASLGEYFLQVVAPPSQDMQSVDH
jgi:hypothetical protein